MAKRGFFAEMQHQNQVAARQRQQAALRAQKQQATAARQAERQRAQQQRAATAQEKQRLREEQQAYVASQLAHVEAMNAEAAQQLADIEAILSAAIDGSGPVDLERFRVVVDHPPFPAAHLEQPSLPPPPLVAPEEPQYVEPPAPSGLGSVFGGKKKHEAAVAAAQAVHAEAHAQWQAAVAQVPAQQLQQMQAHQQAEFERQRQLAEARAKYEAECAEREQSVAATNQQLDDFIAGLEAGSKESVEEYVDLVLGSSGYPECFTVQHTMTFDPASHELTIVTKIPAPDELPMVREYRYNKAKDEITSSALTQKALRDLYATGLHRVALRVFHEVFAADHRRHVQTIALTVLCEGIDPATGTMASTCLLAVAADRPTFESFDLRNVVPSATLDHMHALVSKNPYGRVAVDPSRGVRGGT